MLKPTNKEEHEKKPNNESPIKKAISDLGLKNRHLSGFPIAEPKVTSSAGVPQVAFDSSVYSTSPKEYATWLDMLIAGSGLSAKFVIILCGLFPYLVGLLISTSIGFADTYIRSKAIYIGVFGIIWVLSIVRYASQNIHNAYEQLRPCFLIDDPTYKSIIHKWFSKFSNHFENIAFSLLFALISWIVTYFSFFRFRAFAKMGIESLRPTLFSDDWYSPEYLTVKALILGFWGLCIAFPFGTSFRLLVINQKFLIDLRALPVVPLPEIIFGRLQRITNIYVAVTFTWLVGVALWGVLLFNRLDVFSLACLSILSSIGLLTFFTPQFIYRGYLLRSQLISSQWILSAFYKKFDMRIHEQNATIIPIEAGSNIVDAKSILEFAKTSARTKAWVYNPSDFIWLVIGQVIAIGSLYLKEILVRSF